MELELPKDEKYSLEMANMTIPETLAKENLKYLLDINLMKNQEIVQVNGCPMRVKLILPDELKDYDSYEVVYVKDGKIMERFKCTVEDGCVIFNTMHLSLYGIVAVVTLKNAGKRHWSEPEWIAEVQAAVKQVAEK